MKEVYPNIFSITEKGSLGAIKPPENIYVLAGEDGLIFDAGYGSKWNIAYVFQEIKKIYKEFKIKGKKIHLSRILPSHTHPDHVAGLKRLGKQLRLEVLLTKRMYSIIKSQENFLNSHAAEAIRDLLYTETGSVSIWRQLQQFGWFILYKFVYGLKFIEDPDKFIPEEGEIQINGDSWRILHTPGHAPDHISLYNASKGVLFSGDNILRTVITWLGPPNSNIESYMKTLKKIRDLDNLKFIFPAHGGPVKNPKERIDEILEHRKSREELVYKIILNNPHRGISPSQILKTIYPGAGFSFYNIARGWVCLTLKLLEEKDKIYRKVGKHEFKFCPKKTI